MVRRPALARAYGLHREMVEETVQLEAGFERAQPAKSTPLIEVRIDPESTSPRATLLGFGRKP